MGATAFEIRRTRCQEGRWQQHSGYRLRDLLTGLAIVLIVILTAALAAPYFIDWNGQRGFLEARLSSALGQPVAIGGTIDLKLLPTPYLSLRQTRIGRDDGPVTVAIRTLDLELAVAPLLHGAFDILEARLGEPTVRVTLGRDRTLPALPAAPAFAADVAFERIDVSDGTLAIADPLSDHTYVYEHLDVSAEAPALAGPFKATGMGGPADARTPFRFSTSAARDSRTRLRFNVGETAGHPGLDLDGMLALGDAGHGSPSEGFDGTLALTGRTPLGGGAPVPWRLSGPVKAGPRSATVRGGELRLGTDAAGLTLRADVSGDLGGSPRLTVTLGAKQLDVDRLSGAPVDALRPTPPRLPPLADLRDAVARATPPIPTTVDLTIDAATWGGDTISAVTARWSDDGRRRPALRFAATGPGGSHLALDGALPPVGFTGSVDMGADNLPVALAWLARIDRGAGPGPRGLPFQSAGIAGQVTSGPGGVEARALTIRLDQSTVGGEGRLAFADGPAPTKVTLGLRARAFDLGALPPLAALRAAAPYDIDLTLDADRVALGGDGALDAGPVSLALAKAGDTVTLTSLKAHDLAGATIDARGQLDPRGASVTAAVEAPRLDGVAALVRRLVPGATAEALADRAPALAPANLTIDLAMAGGADGALRPRHLSIAGRAGGTAVTATLAPSTGEGGPTDGIVLDASLDAPEGAALLRQLGWVALPIDGIGRSRVTLHASGPSGQALDTTVHAALGVTTLDVAGRFGPLIGARADRGTGDAHLTSTDLGPLLRSLALAPDAADRVPADVGGHLASDRAGVTLAGLAGNVDGVAAKGDLRWHYGTGEPPALTGTLDLDRLRLSALLAPVLGPARPGANGARFSSERFSGGLVDPPRAKLALKIAKLDVTDGVIATDARLDLGVAPGVVTLRDGTATLAGGRLTGAVSVRRGDGDATLEGRVALDKVRLATPGATAVLTGTLDLAGGGSTASGLVASLAGGGTARASGLSVPRADPAALPKVFAALEADALAVDEASIVRALEDGSAGAIALGDRRFDLGLVGGVLRVTPSQDTANEPRPAGPIVATFEAALDLRASRLDEHVRETLLALPPNWSGAAPAVTFTLAGPIEDQRRSIDVGGLIDAVATRALARESARIEAYETDIRERAFFAARLRSEERRERDRLKIEDDARKAAADREAARVDQLRREEAARAAAARTEQGITEAIQARAAAAKAAREKAIQGEGDDDGRRSGDERGGQDGRTGTDRSDTSPGDPAAVNRHGTPGSGRAM